MISELFIDFSKDYPNILDNNFDGLISTDFIRSEFAVTIDHRFLNVTDNYVKLICWYDNEWGYSSKVVDLISILQMDKSDQIFLFDFDVICNSSKELYKIHDTFLKLLNKHQIHYNESLFKKKVFYSDFLDNLKTEILQ